MNPVVAIVGRPNVGKSTLFNRLIGAHKAIVADEPGVTRDLNFGTVTELGRTFTAVDTGGFEPDTRDFILSEIKEQAELAIEEADVIVFVTDVRSGLTPQDTEVAGMLRRSGKPVVYAVNKVDSARLESELGDFYSMGGGPVVGVSAEHGRGFDELMDAVIELLPKAEEPAPEPEGVKVTILGRPNAGKSSLLNRLIGKKRAIVSNVAGTTRDPVDTPAEINGKKYLFIDTAGIRRKNRVSLKVESYCVMEAIKTLERADVAVLVIDGHDGLKGQDERIAGLIDDRKRCAVIVVNKWDMVEKDTKTMDALTKIIAERMPYISYAPVVFTSALTGQRVDGVIEAIDRVVEVAATRVQTSTLNAVVSDITYRHKPPVYQGHAIKFYYATQTAVSPPAFVLFANYPEGVDDSYKRYLTNRLREALGLDCVPMRLFIRKRH